MNTAPASTQNPRSENLAEIHQVDPSTRRIIARWLYGAFAIGIVLALLITAVRVAISGWRILPLELVFHLLWAPMLAAIVGFGCCPAVKALQRSGTTIRPRMSTRLLMVLIAYIALFFGAGVSTQRLGSTARLYYGKAVNSHSMAAHFRLLRDKFETDLARKLENAAALRAGTIPEPLPPIQKDFLRSLDRDPKVTAEYRKYRYSLIADGEEVVANGQRQGLNHLRALIEYHDKLAPKYDRAQWRPWIPVEPDPPMPESQ